MKDFVEKWNEEYFDGKLGSSFLDALNGIDTRNSELIEFINTYLYYLHLAGAPAQEMHTSLARFLADQMAPFLPSFWGFIPPITRRGRMRVLDPLTDNVLSLNEESSITFLDVGCGHPPVSTIETAELHPSWNCVGIDPVFPGTVIMADADLAGCFDEDGTLKFVQYLRPGAKQEDGDILAQDKMRLRNLWSAVQKDSTVRRRMIDEGLLVLDPLSAYRRKNLVFENATLIDFHTDMLFDLVRCMNVFMYFDGQSIRDNISAAGTLLAENGHFVFGSVGPNGDGIRLTSYKKTGCRLRPSQLIMDLRKFGFHEFTAWYGFYRDQPDAQIHCRIIALLGESPKLRKAVANVIEEFEVSHGVSSRDEEGVYQRESCVLAPASLCDELNRSTATHLGTNIARHFQELGFAAHVRAEGYLVIDLVQSDSALYQDYLPLL